MKPLESPHIRKHYYNFSLSHIIILYSFLQERLNDRITKTIHGAK